MTESDRDKILLEIQKQLGEIITKLNADYRALYGNGKKGLLDEHHDLELRVQQVEQANTPSNADLDARLKSIEQDLKRDMQRKSTIVTWVALGLNAAGTIWAIFFKK